MCLWNKDPVARVLESRMSVGGKRLAWWARLGMIIKKIDFAKEEVQNRCVIVLKLA
jgi:hypothetical protein